MLSRAFVLRRLVDEEVLRRFWADPAVLARLAAAEVAVREGALTAGAAADQVLGAR